jgi:leucyl-tRNA synthetase
VKIAIAKMMEFLNDLQDFNKKDSVVLKKACVDFALLLAPFAPHIAEELWHTMGFEDTIFAERYPDYDEGYLHFEEIEIPVQINGKVRGKVTVPKGAGQEEVLKKALEVEKIKSYVEGNDIEKVVFVQDRLLNIVIKTRGR